MIATLYKMIDETIVTLTLNYGVLGLWTASLLWDKVRYHKERQEEKAEFKIIIDNNTQALTRVLDKLERI